MHLREYLDRPVWAAERIPGILIFLLTEEAGLVRATQQGRHRLYRWTEEKLAVVSEREINAYLEEKTSAVPEQAKEITTAPTI
jgi:DNA-binding transcriptional ArsR family regulator